MDIRMGQEYEGNAIDLFLLQVMQMSNQGLPLLFHFSNISSYESGRGGEWEFVEIRWD